MNKFELEKELEKFQLNPLQSSARNNLMKLVRIIGPLTLGGGKRSSEMMYWICKNWQNVLIYRDQVSIKISTLRSTYF